MQFETNTPSDKIGLQINFGAATADIYPMLRHVQDMAECTDVTIQREGCGWYSVRFKKSDVVQYLKLLHWIGSRRIEEQQPGNTPWASLMPQIHLHNAMLQHLLLSKSDLEDRVSEQECKERHQTVAAAISDAIGQSRQAYFTDNNVSDLRTHRIFSRRLA